MQQAQIDRIANNLIAAKHQPNHPSYKAFVAETIEQHRAILQSGVVIRYVSGTLTGSSQDLFNGLDNGKMVIAVDGSPMIEDHPLLEMRGLVSLNSMFRAVHDYFGHYATRTPFETLNGEIAAYRNHSALYSPEAQEALFGETMGQLCYYFSKGSFVPVQKCAIIPIEEV